MNEGAVAVKHLQISPLNSRSSARSRGRAQYQIFDFQKIKCHAFIIYRKVLTFCTTAK